MRNGLKLKILNFSKSTYVYFYTREKFFRGNTFRISKKPKIGHTLESGKRANSCGEISLQSDWVRTLWRESTLNVRPTSVSLHRVHLLSENVAQTLCSNTLSRERLDPVSTTTHADSQGKDRLAGGFGCALTRTSRKWKSGELRGWHGPMARQKTI